MTSMQSPPQSPEQDDPTDMPYNEEFTESLMHTVLNPPSPSGIVVLDKKDRSAPVEGESVRADDVDAIEVDPSELPLPLDDPRRIYRSPVPGVRLTQPGGMIEGGGFKPPTDEGKTVPPDVERFAQQFIRDGNIRSQTQLRKQIHAEISRQKEELARCMAERQHAIEKNERIDVEIEQHEAQRAMERRLEAKMREMSKSRRDS